MAQKWSDDIQALDMLEVWKLSWRFLIIISVLMCHSGTNDVIALLWSYLFELDVQVDNTTGIYQYMREADLYRWSADNSGGGCEGRPSSPSQRAYSSHPPLLQSAIYMYAHLLPSCLPLYSSMSLILPTILNMTILFWTTCKPYCWQTRWQLKWLRCLRHALCRWI